MEPTFTDHNEKPKFSCDEVVARTDPSLPTKVKRTGVGIGKDLQELEIDFH